MRCLEPLRTLNLKSALLLLIFALQAAALTTIDLKERVEYKTPILLGEAASIDTKNRNLKDFLSSIKLDKKYLSDFKIEKEEIEEALKKSLIDTSHIRITGKSDIVFDYTGPKSLEKAIRSYVEGQYRDVVMEKVAVNGKKLPKTHARIVIKPSSKTFKHIYLTLKFYKDGRLLERARAHVYVSEFIRLPFAKRDIPKSKVIKPDDILFKRVKKRSSTQRALKMSDIAAKVAKRNIYANKEIKPAYVEPDYEVKRGGMVKIIHQKGAIRIEMPGRALESGQRGDIIKVKNISSNKALKCKVLSSSSVLFVR